MFFAGMLHFGVVEIDFLGGGIGIDLFKPDSAGLCHERSCRTLEKKPGKMHGQRVLAV